MQDQSKILVMGLDNSGKTSLIMSRSGVKNLLSYCNLKPTSKIKINEICIEEKENKTAYIWDFGGQQAYREGYLAQLERYAEGAEYLMYVVDIQDPARYDLSLQYFKSIIKILTEANIFLKIEIYLHKYDPYLGDEQLDTDRIGNHLLQELKASIPEKSPYRIYKTSIYTVFQQSLIEQDMK